MVSVKTSNEFVNAYAVSENFSFADVAFTAKRGELGIVLNNYTDSEGSILYHYVRVLFQRGMVGIVHAGLLEVHNKEVDEDSNAIF